MQQADGFVAMGHRATLQGRRQVFHLFGEQGRAVELDHLQTAMDLMDTCQALLERVQRLRVLDQLIEGKVGLLQRFGNFALDPFKGHIVVPITHNHSSQNSFPACRVQVLSVPRSGTAGKVKPDTERRN